MHHLYGDELYVVEVSSLEQQLRLFLVVGLIIVHRVRVQHEAVSPASQMVKNLKEHNRVAQVVDIRDILSVREAGPVNRIRVIRS